MIKIFGECYSSNLGDGVIAQCACWAARNALGEGVGNEVSIADLSGRLQQEKLSAAPKPAGLGSKIPTSLKGLQRLVEWQAYDRRRLDKFYRSQAQGVNYAIIGGGQLLADRYYNFPLKLSLLTRILGEFDIPYSFLGCGMDHFSGLGAQLIRQSLEGADFIGLRDNESITLLADSFPAIKAKAILSPDFALLSPHVYPNNSSKVFNSFILGPIAQSKVTKFLPTVSAWPKERYEAFWLRIAQQLRDRGPLVLLSNGESGDTKLCRALEARLNKEDHPEVTVATPSTANELIDVIKSARGIIAARLHALVPAEAFDVPCVGISWDPKVSNFFSLLQIEDACLSMKDAAEKSPVEMLAARQNRQDRKSDLQRTIIDTLRAVLKRA